MAADDRGELGYRAVLRAMYASLVKMVESGFLSDEEQAADGDSDSGKKPRRVSGTVWRRGKLCGTAYERSGGLSR
jgi:hypothetical protein